MVYSLPLQGILYISASILLDSRIGMANKELGRIISI